MGRFLDELTALGSLNAVGEVRVELFGSLALTGLGHGTDRAVALGLMGVQPEAADPEHNEACLCRLKEEGELTLPGGPRIPYDPSRHLGFRGDVIPKAHPNGMCVAAVNASGETLLEQTYYSVGGGAVRREDEMGKEAVSPAAPSVPFPFQSACELLELCETQGLSMAELALMNEDARRSRDETVGRLDDLWRVMSECVERGLATQGVLPGGLNVTRRAPQLYQKLRGGAAPNEREALFDWLNVYAMAVNEENAAGGRVVTAPTNGAAGVIPAVVKFYCASEGVTELRNVRIFLATAACIGMLYKARASISGAEMGCQGEVGVACSMAAAGLAAVWGATNPEIEHAAEIAMEHNLGLTCDPVGGLVQIPCIERNAIGAVKAVNAARLAMRSGGQHKVTLDQVIETMRQTGQDMSSKYKETSEGGLAVNVVEC